MKVLRSGSCTTILRSQSGAPTLQASGYGCARSPSVLGPCPHIEFFDGSSFDTPVRLADTTPVSVSTDNIAPGPYASRATTSLRVGSDTVDADGSKSHAAMNGCQFCSHAFRRQRFSGSFHFISTAVDTMIMSNGNLEFSWLGRIRLAPFDAITDIEAGTAVHLHTTGSVEILIWELMLRHPPADDPRGQVNLAF
jgi:hypothetical protein